jgi:aryl-alcohol dehydrogenase-like predicted oxidoreductase
MKSTEMPKKLEITTPQISKLAKFAEDQGLTIPQLCLSYAMQIPWAESIVVGANSINQLSEILKASNDLIDIDWSEFEVIPEPWIDPRNW